MAAIKQQLVAVAACTVGMLTACSNIHIAESVTSGDPPELVNNSPFYVDPGSEAAQQAITWKDSDPVDATRMRVIAAHPQAQWFGSWNKDVALDADVYVLAAKAAGKIPILVAYNIPHLDCRKGGAPNAAAYKKWIQSFADGIGDGPALVVLEPDALPDLPCLSNADQTERIGLIAFAIETLKAFGHSKVYVDAGNANWIPAKAMGEILTRVGIAGADGFSLNVSNFYTTDATVQYGDSLSALVGNAHFVIDTSRNGNGSNGQWCNPSGRALGAFPTVDTKDPLLDALLWIKRPGESDGPCNGGPSYGTWWPQYAADLAANAGY